MKNTLILSCSILFVFLIIREQVYARKCYVCNSIYDTRCSNENSLPEEFKQDCGNDDPCYPYDVCRKIIHERRSNYNTFTPHTRVIRECGRNPKLMEPSLNNSELRVKKYCYEQKDRWFRIQTCTCLQDYCNVQDMQNCVTYHPDYAFPHPSWEYCSRGNEEYDK